MEKVDKIYLQFFCECRDSFIKIRKILPLHPIFQKGNFSRNSISHIKKWIVLQRQWLCPVEKKSVIRKFLKSVISKSKNMLLLGEKGMVTLKDGKNARFFKMVFLVLCTRFVV